MVAQWKVISRKLGPVINTASSFSLKYALGDALREFKFEKMDPRCREALIKELSDRAESFHGRIIQAATAKLMTLAASVQKAASRTSALGPLAM